MQIDPDRQNDVVKSFFWALPFFIIGFLLMFFNILVFPFFFLLGLICMAQSFAGLASDSFAQVFMLKDNNYKPFPGYGRIEILKNKQNYEEAILELEEILENDSEQLKGWIMMLEIIINDLNNIDRAEYIYAKAQKKLNKAEQKDYLQKVYQHFLDDFEKKR